MNKRSLLLPAAVAAVLLTSTSLAQVFEEQRWWLPSLLAVAVAFGAGWAARRLDVPGVLSPALSLLALTTLLGVVFLPETTAAGLPTAATMQGIGESLSAAGSDIKSLAPPAPATEALTLLATAGVFLVAMLVDLMAFSLRRPVAVGMPLLALFLIPTSMASKANVFAFILAAIGYLGVLVAEGRDRARNWGRRLSGMELPDDFADVTHVARVGRRIGSAAVGVALCVPLAVPSVGQGLFNGSGGGLFGKGRGSHTAYVLNPIVEIRAKLQDKRIQPLFTVRTDKPQYLRLTSLDQFDGDSWSLVKRPVETDHRVGRKKTIPAPREMEGIQTTEATYEVAIGDLAVNWLPVPYAPAKVDVEGDWRWEEFGLSVFNADKTSQGVAFTAQSRLPEPTVEQLRDTGPLPRAIAEEYLAVPPGTPPIALQVLEEQTRGLENPYDIALALNQYFFKTGRFRYDVDVALANGKGDLESFLVNKVGYCEQFAAAMAYLSRLAGIPARVVVGFTPGTLRNDGRYVVTNRDAHAWPELYFPSTGWVRFEPTTRNGTQRPGYAVPPDTSPGPGEDPAAEPTAEPTAPPAEEDSGLPRQRAEADDNAAVEPDAALNPVAAPRRGGRVPVLPLALALVVIALVAPSAAAWGTRRRRRTGATDHLGRIHAAWESLADAAEDAGYALRSADSPRGAARRLVAAASLTGEAADEVLRLAAAEERARYALTAPPADGLDAGVRTVRRSLLAALPARARLRATVFPASAVRRIFAATRSFGDTVDRTRTAARARLVALARRRTRTA